MSVSSKFFIVILIILLVMIPLAAQDVLATVPDVSGLTLAQAAAELNRAGLVLGTVDYDIAITPDITEPDYVIINQAVPVGTSVEQGTAVAVTFRYYNVLLRYDNNEFHVINLSGMNIGLDNLTFETDDRSFRARDWGDALVARNCVQAWSINVNNFYEPPECTFVQGGIGVQRNISASKQFWISDDGATQTFRIVQNGMLRGECSVATDVAETPPQNTCAVWLASQQPAEDMTDYWYFVYNAHYLYIHNRSTSQWMPIPARNIAEAPRSLVETRFLGFTPIANLDFLAPQQCLFITGGTPFAEDAAPLTTCDVAIQVNYTNADRFWRNGFTVSRMADSTVAAARSCPSVVGDERSVCLIPR